MDSKNHYTIAINREAGSGGRSLAERLGEKLGINVYTKAALEGLIEHFGLTEGEIEHLRTRKQSWWDEVCQFNKQFAAAGSEYEVNREVTPKQVYHMEEKLLKEIAERESCIIVGRAAFHIFKDTPSVKKLFFIADRDYRIAHMKAKLGVDDREAARIIDETDKERETYTKNIMGVSRYDCHNYDMVLNITNKDPEKMADFLAAIVKAEMQ